MSEKVSLRRRSNAWDAALKRNAEGKPPEWMVETGETEFERLLREANIKPADAAGFLMVQEWVRRNYRTKYCPPDILKAVGVYDEEVA